MISLFYNPFPLIANSFSGTPGKSCFRSLLPETKEGPRRHDPIKPYGSAVPYLFRNIAYKTIYQIILGQVSLLNGNIFILFHLRSRFFLRNPQLQNSMFKLSLNILLCQIFSHIEAPLTGAAETFFPDITAVFRLFLLRLILLG